jgi:purine-binding chemotaxis protein CheW
MEEHSKHSQNHNDIQDTTDTANKIELLRKLKESKEPETEVPSFQIVVISLDNELYGIRILSVREILKVKKITWVPCTPESIVGVISVRGDVQSVVDLKHFLQFGSSQQITENSRIILVESKDLVTGLLVDEMVDIINVPVSDFLPLTEANISVAQKYVEGKLPWNDNMITLLNIDTLIQGVVVNQG